MHEWRSHRRRQKNYGLHTVACIHNIAHMNCNTGTYFFPKQNVTTNAPQITILFNNYRLIKLQILIVWRFRDLHDLKDLQESQFYLWMVFKKIWVSFIILHWNVLNITTNVQIHFLRYQLKNRYGKTTGFIF